MIRYQINSALFLFNFVSIVNHICDPFRLYFGAILNVILTVFSLNSTLFVRYLKVQCLDFWPQKQQYYRGNLIMAMC